MPTEEHPFFRSRALQHYLEAREESVAPRLISPPVFACLWILLSLLVVGIAGASFFKIPVYAPGVAVVTRGACAVKADCRLMIVALLPPESLSRLRVGQTIYLERAGNSDRLRASDDARRDCLLRAGPERDVALQPGSATPPKEA